MTAYVDLNPIRAGITVTPETSEFTSIQARLSELVRARREKATASTATQETRPSVRLLGFRDQLPAGQPAIPFSARRYIELIDWTGRSVREGKRGAVDARLPSMMEHLSVDRDAWLGMMELRGNAFGRAIGRWERLRQHAKRLGNGDWGLLMGVLCCVGARWLGPVTTCDGPYVNNPTSEDCQYPEQNP